MRKIYLIMGMWAALFSVKAQQVATFEEINLQPGSFYNGSDGSGGFMSGGIWFPNTYNSGYNYWSKFAVSNMKDTLVSGYANQYSVMAAGGADTSENFAVVYAPQEFSLPFNNPVKVNGFYITNSVYAYKSLRNGDEWTKKFGGANGTDPDYFRLMLSGKDATGNLTDTLEFFLADFRFENSNEDYIVKDWHWLDLSSLGVIEELILRMESSDVGEWGINTPAYFCIDNFTVSDIASHSGSYDGLKEELKVYPNPVKDLFNIEVTEYVQEISLFSGSGTIIWKETFSGKGNYAVSALVNMPSGLYFLQVKTVSGISSQKIIKY